MTITRAHLVDPSVSSWYHCVTCCVRQAFLLGEGMQDRKSWNEHRLEELAEIFALAGVWFAILDNHLHLLVRLDPDVARYWSDEDVVRRWGFEPGCRRHRRDSRGQRPYLDQAAGRACQGRGTNRGPERRPSRQRRGLDCGGGPGGGAVALSSRGSTAAGFVTRRDTRRIFAGQYSAGVCSWTRGNLAARHADCAGLVNQSDKNGWPLSFLECRTVAGPCYSQSRLEGKTGGK